MGEVRWFHDERRDSYTAWLVCTGEGCRHSAKIVLTAAGFAEGRAAYEGTPHFCGMCGSKADFVRRKTPEAITEQDVKVAVEEVKSILHEALEITGTGGARNSSYGHPRVNFRNIAAGWEVIFGVKVTERQVAQAMIWTKVARDIHKPGRDNLVDIAGYARTIERLEEKE